MGKKSDDDIIIYKKLWADKRINMRFILSKIWPDSKNDQMMQVKSNGHIPYLQLLMGPCCLET